MTAAAILAAIDETIDRKIAQLEAETSRGLEQLAAETAVTAAQKREQAHQNGTASLAEQLTLGQQQASLRAGRVYQNARAELIATALDRLADQLNGLRAEPGRYEALLDRLLREAVALLEREDGQIILRVDPRDKALLEGLLRRSGISALESRFDLNTAGGLIISNAGGSVIVDNTLETRFERARPILQQEIAAALDLPQELSAGP